MNSGKGNRARLATTTDNPRTRADKHRTVELTSHDSTNLVIMLGMMQVSKRIPFDDPFVLN
jgi:hypothetical protein